MIVLVRFRVPAGDVDFADQARTAIAVLAERVGFVSADLGRNIDEPTAYEDPDLLGENVGRGHDDRR